MLERVSYERIIEEVRGNCRVSYKEWKEGRGRKAVQGDAGLWEGIEEGPRRALWFSGGRREEESGVSSRGRGRGGIILEGLVGGEHLVDAEIAELGKRSHSLIEKTWDRLKKSGRECCRKRQREGKARHVERGKKIGSKHDLE